MSRRAQSIVQTANEINEDIEFTIQNFVKKYNKHVKNLNDTINNISHMTDEEVEQITPFLGNPKTMLTLSDLNKLLSDDYKLVNKQQLQTENGTQTESAETFNGIASLLGSMEKASLQIKNTLDKTNVSETSELQEPYEEIDVKDDEPILVLDQKKEVKFADEYDIITFDKNEPIIGK